MNSKSRLITFCIQLKYCIRNKSILFYFWPFYKGGKDDFQPESLLKYSEDHENFGVFRNVLNNESVIVINFSFSFSFS